MTDTERPVHGFDITTSTAAEIESAIDTIYWNWRSQTSVMTAGQQLPFESVTLLVADHEEYALLGTECRAQIDAMHDTVLIVPGIRRPDGSLIPCVLCAITPTPNQ